MPWFRIKEKDEEQWCRFLLDREVMAAGLTQRIHVNGKCIIPHRRQACVYGLSRSRSSELEGILALFTDGFTYVLIDGHLPLTPRQIADGLPSQLLWKRNGIRTLMGNRLGVSVIELYMGRPPTHREDYTMMYKEPQNPNLPGLKVPIPGRPRILSPHVSIYRTTPEDHLTLLPLQMQYEQEEVALPGHPINPQVTRRFFYRSLKTQLAFHLCVDGRAVSKASSNARGIGVVQVGGVFTLPAYRGHGYAEIVMETLIREIHSRGKTVSLFVKNRNHPAQGLYKKLAFTAQEEVSIVYYTGS
ncbi:GNAT family N-acetyltransferase [Spirochaeta lutea]|uniref:GNAT family N-acetyltransferase n=1 Tax=Spirochaeta lutea TaxID=1480694 RepID=UPI00068B77CF|nr:GNAT family N-acetyltransferase [Spirochaeta lutea]